MQSRSCRFGVVDFGHMLTVGAIHFKDTVYMVVNFCNGFVFVLFTSQGPFVKLKLLKSASVPLMNITQANQEISAM